MVFQLVGQKPLDAHFVYQRSESKLKDVVATGDTSDLSRPTVQRIQRHICQISLGGEEVRRDRSAAEQKTQLKTM
jgi:hypothetical protein